MRGTRARLKVGVRKRQDGNEVVGRSFVRTYWDRWLRTRGRSGNSDEGRRGGEDGEGAVDKVTH